MEMTEPRDPFNPNDPAVQILLLAQRVENLGREKEAIERDLEREQAERDDLERRVVQLETYFSKDKSEKIDNAIQFMNNAEFMGKWTWRGIAGFIFLSGGFYAAFKFWKG